MSVYKIDYGAKGNCLPIKASFTNPHTKVTKHFEGIFDTGATNTVVSNKIAKALDLINEDYLNINEINGSTLVPITTVHIGFDANVVFNKIKVSVCDLGSELDALIGLDIIGQCDFLLTNVNKTVLQLRSPAIADGVCL